MNILIMNIDLMEEIQTNNFKLERKKGSKKEEFTKLFLI